MNKIYTNLLICAKKAALYNFCQVLKWTPLNCRPASHIDVFFFLKQFFIGYTICSVSRLASAAFSVLGLVLLLLLLLLVIVVVVVVLVVFLVKTNP